MNEVSLHIREFGWADYEAVVTVWRTVGSEPLSQDELQAKLRRDPELFLVAADGGTIAGVILGTYDGRRGFILRLAVDPARRREGIATRLVAELEHRLKALGCPRINLFVLPDNAAGLAFWRHHGYLPIPDVVCTKPL
jgi:ribosomal protein S18 acetylase RimI-like enzyme